MILHFIIWHINLYIQSFILIINYQLYTSNNYFLSFYVVEKVTVTQYLNTEGLAPGVYVVAS